MALAARGAAQAAAVALAGVMVVRAAVGMKVVATRAAVVDAQVWVTGALGD